MRRLLIRLVAVETMLTGWLAYWLFLVYANNPLVSQGLSLQLGKFPQLTFTTVDISVLVIIAGLSILIAVKFQRGLRPGIRLERALQMLESLMKRNLVLEAQVAEMKLEKAHAGTSIPSSSTLPSLSAEAKPGSWDRVFRTPIEAGPIATTVQSRPSSIGEDSLRRAGSLVRTTPTIEPKQSLQRPSILPRDKGPSEKPDFAAEVPPKTFPGMPAIGPSHSAWEDIPKPSSDTAATKPTGVSRAPANVVSVSLSKQPYIPLPVPKSAVPPIVITGPGVLPPRQQATPQPKPPAKSTVGVQPPPTDTPPFAEKPRQPVVDKPAASLMPLGVASPRPSPVHGVFSPVSKPDSPVVKESAKEVSDTKSKLESKTEAKVETKGETKAEVKAEARRETKNEAKPVAKPLKKFAYEED